MALFDNKNGPIEFHRLMGAIQPSPPLYNTNRNVATGEPVPYWCGRLVSLNDRYCNEERDSEGNRRRMGRAMEHLHDSCTSVVAREAFGIFEKEMGRSLVH